MPTVLFVHPRGQASRIRGPGSGQSDAGRRRRSQDRADRGKRLLGLRRVREKRPALLRRPEGREGDRGLRRKGRAAL